MEAGRVSNNNVPVQNLQEAQEASKSAGVQQDKRSATGIFGRIKNAFRSFAEKFHHSHRTLMSKSDVGPGIRYFMYEQRLPQDETCYDTKFLNVIQGKNTLENILAEAVDRKYLNEDEKAGDWKPEFAEKFKAEVVKRYFENPSAVKTEKYKEKIMSWAGEMKDDDLYKLSKNFDRSNLPDEILKKLNAVEVKIFESDESLANAINKLGVENFPPAAWKKCENVYAKKGDTDFLDFAGKIKDWTKLSENSQERLQKIFDKAYSDSDAETLDKVYATMDDVHFIGNLNPKEVPNLPDGAMNRLKIYFATLPEDQFLSACEQFGPENLPEGAKRKYDATVPQPLPPRNTSSPETTKTEGIKSLDFETFNASLPEGFRIINETKTGKLYDKMTRKERLGARVRPTPQKAPSLNPEVEQKNKEWVRMYENPLNTEPKNDEN